MASRVAMVAQARPPPSNPRTGALLRVACTVMLADHATRFLGAPHPVPGEQFMQTALGNFGDPCETLDIQAALASFRGSLVRQISPFSAKRPKSLQRLRI